LDEAETIAICISKAKRCLEQLTIAGEIIVADNGSTDNSIAIAEGLGARVAQVREKGYGSALRGGIDAARGRWILIGDADDTYDFSEAAPFVEKLKDGYDLVIGCRLPHGGGTIMAGAMPWKHRHIGNPVLSKLGRLFFKSPVTDFHCGLRAFTREAYERMNLRTTGMEFASEMVIKATLRGMRIAELPITLYKGGRSRPPHLRSWRDGWRHLRFMLLLCPTWLFLVPGVLLLLAGIALGIRLWIGPLSLWIFTFDTNTLLISSMSMIVGLQIILFGVFTRVFAMAEGLLPENPTWSRIARVFSLEKGILAGLLILSCGLVLLVKAVLYWKAAKFGSISYPESLRQVIPAVTMMTLGVQVIFSSFFLSILGIPRR
jgi:glycosyltransferase involved in cell wall biosynthesis